MGVFVEKNYIFNSHDIVSLLPNTPLKSHWMSSKTDFKRTALSGTEQNSMLRISFDNNLFQLQGYHLETNFCSSHGEFSQTYSGKSLYGMVGTGGNSHCTPWNIRLSCGKDMLMMSWKSFIKTALRNLPIIRTKLILHEI